MEINVKELEFCKLAIQYVADAEEIANKRLEVLKAFKKAPVPGCRPGKASIDAISMYYRTQISEALKRALAEEAYHNTIFEKKYRPYGMPDFKSTLLETGKFTCSFDLLIKPEFELTTYRNFDIPKPHDIGNVADVSAKMFQDLRVKYGTSEPYSENDFIQHGDNIICDYEGFVDGEKVENLCAQAEMFTVGHSQIPNFDNSLLGMKINDVREFDITVPDDGLPSIAGKTAHFKVTLCMGARNVPCPLGDELAVKLGKKDFAELQNLVNSAASAKISNEFKTAIMDSIANRLLDNHKFEVPSFMSLAEARYLAHNANLKWDDLSDPDREKYIEMAEKNVRVSLILDKIRDSEPEAQVSDQEILEMIKQNITKTHKDVDLNEALAEMSKTGYLQVLVARIRDEYALDFIMKTTKIVE